MKLLLKRRYKKSNYTIGDLYIDGEWYANTLEDKDRNLTLSMSLEEIKKIKVPKETAIPAGTYKVSTSIISPRFSKKDFYKQVCGGKLPRLLNVPGFDGILIHVGDGPRALDLTEGCILVGQNKIVGLLINGKEIFKRLINRLKESNNITITIR